VDADRFARATAAIDAANGADPTTLIVAGQERPRALAEAELVSAWVRRLRPDAGEALLLAARAHHIRRWTSARSGYPEGRAGYLRWRRDLSEFHASEVAAILTVEGYDADLIDRVQRLVRKRDLRTGGDDDVQVLEDAICLTFLEVEFAPLADRLDADHMVDVLRKTLVKMSAEGVAAAASLSLDPREAGLLERATRAPQGR
jgi:hypothetical protein